MSVEVEGLAEGRIRVAGDIERLMIAPYVQRGQPFVLGFSDGTLIEGLFDRLSETYLFQTLVEGAGIVTIEEDRVTLDWAMDWATIAPSTGVMIAEARSDFRGPSVSLDEDGHVGSVAEWLRPRAAHKVALELAALPA